MDKKYYLSERMQGWLKKHGEKRNTGIRLLDDQGKSHCLMATAQAKNNLSTDYICMAMRGRGTCRTSRKPEYGKRTQKDDTVDKISEPRKNIQQLEARTTRRIALRAYRKTIWYGPDLKTDVCPVRMREQGIAQRIKRPFRIHVCRAVVFDG